MALKTTHPRLIQRCMLDKGSDGSGLRYDYMGSSEFEFGNQAKALKRMFERELVVVPTRLIAVNVDVLSVLSDASVNATLFMVAPKDFDFDVYADVIDGLINEEWGMQEPMYIIGPIKTSQGIPIGRLEIDRTQAWFDFTNDVFFTVTEENASSLLKCLARIKAKWAQPEDAAVTAFKRGLEQVKKELAAAGKKWYSLSLVREIDGVLHVWLNPEEQDIHNDGWYNLVELRAWVSDQGPIMIKIGVEEFVD